MSKETDDSVTSAESSAEFAQSLANTLRSIQEMSEEEYERRFAEVDSDGSTMIEEMGLTQEDAVQFLSSVVQFGERKRKIQAEQRDITKFDDDEWEDGFAFYDRIVGDPDGGPSCLECREVLEQNLDEICVAADGAVVYTNCSKCGEDSLEDKRYFSQMAWEDSPPLPDDTSLDVHVDDEIKEEFQSDTDEK